MEEGKRGELWVVEEGKEGKFHLCGGKQGGQGSVLVVGSPFTCQVVVFLY